MNERAVHILQASKQNIISNKTNTLFRSFSVILDDARNLWKLLYHVTSHQQGHQWDSSVTRARVMRAQRFKSLRSCDQYWVKSYTETFKLLTDQVSLQYFFLKSEILKTFNFVWFVLYIMTWSYSCLCSHFLPS